MPTEQVFDESDPLITFNDIYVQLDVQPLTQSGEKKNVAPVNIHTWARNLLEQPEPRKVMFVQGDAGQGKSVFCRMFAAWVRQNLAFSYIPIFIRLRSLRAIENTLTETLENCPDLEPVEFVGKEGWLIDKNTRFLIILDGFDELLLQGRASGGLQEFLQQVSDFQERSHHQCLVTGRPLALQGVEQRITQNKNLERVKLYPMNNELQEQWLTKWQGIFGQQEVAQFRKFLEACPTEISNNLAREPLLIYLLARLHREKQLTNEMFANAKQESQAKLRIYRESVNWVLEKQRQDENVRLSGLDDPIDLREVLQETALCVVQSGNEIAQISMLKARFQDSSNPVAHSLKMSQEAIEQSEDKTLNNLLTTFYLRPSEVDRRGSVEFAHKSFGEYLFAERLMSAFEDWTELDRKKRNRLDDRSVNSQIFDLLGFEGLNAEVVEYLFEMLNESSVELTNLFKRLYKFYEAWCEGDFLDQTPTENLIQKKLLQLREQDISSSLKKIDILAGLNILIILFTLHATSQTEDYFDLSKDGLKTEIKFHPCKDFNSERIQANRLLKIISYSDSWSVGTFIKVLGPHLSKIDLSSADLSSSNLYRAYLLKASLSDTNFSGSNLSSSNLSQSNLSRASFAGANLSSSNLSGANLHRANISRANLYRAELCNINLSRAILIGSDLASADLCGGNLSNANLSRANLSRASLSNANLSKVNFSGTDLSNVNLSGAIVLGAKLGLSNNLSSQQLEGRNPPLICNSTLPPDLESYQDRDCNRLPAALKERYPEKFKSLEAAEKFVNEHHLPSV